MVLTCMSNVFAEILKRFGEKGGLLERYNALMLVLIKLAAAGQF